MKHTSIIILLFIFSCTAKIFANSNFETEIIEFDERVNRALNVDFFLNLNQLPDDKKILLANKLQVFYTIYSKKLNEYSNLYSESFVESSLSQKRNNQSLYFLEMQLKYSINQVFANLVKFKTNSKESTNSKNSNMSFEQLIAFLDDVTTKLDTNTTITRKKTELVSLVLPFKKGSLKYILKFLVNSLLNRPLANITNHHDTRPLLPQTKGLNPIISYFSSNGETIDSAPTKVISERITAIAFNHDHAAFDAYYIINFVKAQFAAKDHQIHILTTKSAWFQFDIFKNNFKNIHLIEDPMFSKKLIDELSQSNPNEKVYFVFAPEGGQTTWEAQFPTIAKPGGYAIIQKLKNLGHDVAYLEVQSNLAEFVSSPNTPFKVDIYGPEPVAGDNWVSKARERFQNRISRYRGQIINLQSPKKVADSRIYQLINYRSIFACKSFYNAK